MFLRNNSRYDDDEVKALVHFAAKHLPIDHHGVCINVKNCLRGPFAGRAYDGVPVISDAPRSARWLVTIRIGIETEFPFDNVWAYPKRRGGKTVLVQHAYGGIGSPKIVYNDWREGLVGVAAHELNHVRQFMNGSPRSEVRCERAALRVLQAWRAQ
jgi:hypothetical protein